MQQQAQYGGSMEYQHQFGQSSQGYAYMSGRYQDSDFDSGYDESLQAARPPSPTPTIGAHLDSQISTSV
jgi:hypothetical protein